MDISGEQESFIIWLKGQDLWLKWCYYLSPCLCQMTNIDLFFTTKFKYQRWCDLNWIKIFWAFLSWISSADFEAHSLPPHWFTHSADIRLASTWGKRRGPRIQKGKQHVSCQTSHCRTSWVAVRDVWPVLCERSGGGNRTGCLGCREGITKDFSVSSQMVVGMEKLQLTVWTSTVCIYLRLEWCCKGRVNSPRHELAQRMWPQRSHHLTHERPWRPGWGIHMSSLVLKGTIKCYN